MKQRMKESYRKGIANHPGPEPCEGGREAALEALDRGTCRLCIELRNRAFSGGRRCHATRKATRWAAINASSPTPCGVVDQSMHGSFVRENREALWPAVGKQTRSAGRRR